MFLCLSVANLSVPMGFGNLAPKAMPRAQTGEGKTQGPSKSRFLTSREMRKMSGKTGECPYFAGQNKWDVVYKGVDVMTGNYSTSVTDLTFQGGYGIPANVTRSYSANNADEGPLGKGWTLSVDLRSTAGGLMKSSSSPVRSVPTAFKERPAAQEDPNVQTDPVEAVIATDAGGKEETIQKDVDGVLTTPPWDKNVIDSTYETVVQSGNVYRILLSNTVLTPDGTTYVYEKKGYYTNGETPYDDLAATATPTNVLKVVSATDRHGNQTTYTYDTGTVTFNKANGQTTENPLTSIHMPNGHQIDFTWGNGTNAPTNRIRTASDGVRTVTYGYTSGLLTSVATPEGRTTQYGYGAPQNGGSSDFLTQITDMRGLVTTIYYRQGESGNVFNQFTAFLDSVYVDRIFWPDGTQTHYSNYEGYLPADNYHRMHFGVTGWKPSAADITSSGQLIYGFVIDGGLTYYSEVKLWFFQLADIDNNGDGPYPINPYFRIERYDPNTQDLLETIDYSYPMFYPGGTGYGTPLFQQRKLYAAIPPFGTNTYVDQTTTYNFMGAPLSRRTKESVVTNYSVSTPRDVTVSYAYWGKDKYYQQKAVKDQAGRISFTDYYDSSATSGRKGQVYRHYDTKRSTFDNAGAGNWKYTVVPHDSATYSSQYDYDAKGRATDVWKIQSTTTSPWTYTQTHSEYGADSSPAWGAPTSVVEDYGSGRINRTTQNLAYDSVGRATDIQDPAGHEFRTTYDLDGLILSVYRVDGSHDDAIVSYSYGSSGLTNGMMTQVTDGLTGVVQDLTYASSGGGKGQLESITETNGASSYTCSYTYNAMGDRETAVFATPNGTTRWGYGDYESFPRRADSARTFQTLRKLDSSSNPTAEEFQYGYTTDGRLMGSTFAQTPASGFTPTTGNPWYDDSHLPSTRARAYYTYDAGGRVASIEHYWDTWDAGENNYNTSTHPSIPILANACTYELSTGLSRGAKTQSDYYVKNSASNTWALSHSDRFGYDADFDYLTSASYDGGSTTTNWTYDAAGNRNDCTVVDNLNRATTIGGVSRTYDIQGNTLSVGTSASMTWDSINRMTSFTSGSTTTNYEYRADGMRVEKSADSTHYSTYAYDGQMPLEVADVAGTATTVTRNGLGGRGIDYIERVDGSGTIVGYPIYDAHGNMVATLGKSGSSFSLGDERAYDAWGTILSGNTSGDPKSRYCATLGHIADDESGLIDMRARMYDPSIGRFLSQDPNKHGFNWYDYCRNDPVNRMDSSGKSDEESDWDEVSEKLDMVAELVKLLYEQCENIDALCKFLDVVIQATDSLDIENAWGKFMGHFANYEDDLDSFTGVFSAINESPTEQLTKGAKAGMDATTIALGYEARILWYLYEF